MENKASVSSLCLVLKSKVVVGVNGGTIGDTTSPIHSFTDGPANGYRSENTFYWQLSNHVKSRVSGSYCKW